MIKHFNYKYYQGKFIQNKNDFYNSGLPELSKIRNLCNILQRLFVTTDKFIDMYILDDNKSYKFEVYSSSKKHLICTVYYLPKEYRLDFYDASDLDSPMFVWKSKKIEYSNLPESLKILKAETLLSPLISIL